MKSMYHFFIRSFFLIFSVQQNLIFAFEKNHLLKLAEEYYDLKLYSETISLLSEVPKKDFSEAEQEKTQLKIALSNLLNKDYNKTLEYIKTLKINELTTLLYSISYRNLKQIHLAEKTITEFIKNEESISPLIFLEATFIKLEQKKVNDAKIYLEKVKEPLSKSIQFLKNILEIFVAQLEENFEKTSSLIQALGSEKENEILWLKGTNAFLMQNYNVSSRYFLKILESKKPSDCIVSISEALVVSLLQLFKNQNKEDLFPLLENGIKQLNYYSKIYDYDFTLLLLTLELLKNKCIGNGLHPEISQLLEKLEENKDPKIFALKLEFQKEDSKNTLLERWKNEEQPWIKGLAYFFSAINDFHEGNHCENIEKKLSLFKKSMMNFKIGMDYQEEIDFLFKGSYINYFLQCSINSKEKEILLDIYQYFLNLNLNIENSYELALLSGHLYEMTQDITYFDQAIKHLEISQNNDKKMLLLGTLFYKKGDLTQANLYFKEIKKNWPESSLVPEALFWEGLSLENTNLNEIQKVFKEIYEFYPKSPYASEAYFKMFPMQEYLQGSRKALKHLEQIPKKFPKSPLTLNALFLCAIDNKRDRKTSSGKWIQHKNIIKAIEYFKHIEDLYEELKYKFKNSEKKRYESLYYRTLLEKAICWITLAQESAEAKNAIYLKYSEETLSLLKDKIKTREITDALVGETYLALVALFEEKKEFETCRKILDEFIEKMTFNGIEKSYYLSLSWQYLGKLSFQEKDFENALNFFLKADTSSEGHILSDDEKLQIWLDISDCYKFLGDYEKAMTLLSKAINENVISSLRIKAMYLRSKIYTLQGRFELARKQLEAVSRLGSDWGKIAEKELRDFYENE